jgi:hypothetical protein
MSQAENRNTTTLSRRAALARLSSFTLGAAIALPAAAAVAQPSATAVSAAPADPELLRLVDEYHVAWSDFERASEVFSHFEEMRFERRHDIPEALRERHEDAGLGLPPVPDGVYRDAESVNRMRAATWTRCSKEPTASEGESVIRVCTAHPSPAARQRADEIIGAFDIWQKKCQRRPRGMRAAERAQGAALTRLSELERQIERTPATSLAGCIAKARVVALQSPGGPIAHFDDTDELIMVSLSRDLVALGGAMKEGER